MAHHPQLEARIIGTIPAMAEDCWYFSSVYV
ncbi:protein of unknown function [Methylocaldum szegediense]|uniref:Uncharacterized protein n=1 Tax=Methylocaldum szegediense TaxID=73780 RepID=A0ABN8X2Z7_9GAMM|nr:protein of unknown function [Methylocaldum szegediense]